MSMNCSVKNTCSIVVSTNCVDYAGTLLEGSYISLTGCDITLTDYLAEVDRLLKELKDADGISKQLLTQYNCSFAKITDLITATTGDKATTAGTVVAMLRTMCDLQTRIAALESADIYNTLLPQDVDFQVFLNERADCLDVDPCNPSLLTLRDLLTKLILKHCP